jgi:hypothetical protein
MEKYEEQLDTIAKEILYLETRFLMNQSLLSEMSERLKNLEEENRFIEVQLQTLKELEKAYTFKQKNGE